MRDQTICYQGANIISVFNAGAKKFADDIDREIKAGRYLRGELFVEFVKQAVPSGSFILDYGCGPGRISLMLARSGFEVLGVDPSETMLEQAKEQHHQGLSVQFRVGDETILPPDSFDAIICSSVIEYVPEPDKLLQRFHDSLREKGVLVISYSNRVSPLRLYSFLTKRQNVFSDAYRHQWSWSDFRKLLTCNGFRPLAGPKFFEFNWRIERFVQCLPLGTLGIVLARKTKNSVLPEETTHVSTK